MKTRTFLITLIVIGFVVAVVSELGVFRRAFDTRSIVEDGVVGADYWIVAVDGKPTDRVQHGNLVTVVPYALLEQGDRLLELSTIAQPTEDSNIIRLRTTIETGVRYRILRNQAGNPELVAKN